MIRKTKIICTIGPSVETKEKILQLIDAGMDVARLNFSHGEHEYHEKMIRLLKEAREEKGVPLAIMLDTKGPEIRIGKIEKGEVEFESGDQCELVDEKEMGSKNQIPIKPLSALESIHLGAHILFDDGYVSSRVIEIKDKKIRIEFLHGGKIRSGKGVNVPDVSVNLPAITEKDLSDITFGCEQGIDLIAASFVRSADHVMEIQKIIEKKTKNKILIIAKIENREGVDHVDSIIQVADGIMIARGDLGVEVPLSQVPRLQKEMIRKSYHEGKTAVIATQMLESMIQNPRPTRAEVSDVANAIYDSASAVMLSGESAIGKYPIQTVNVMRSVIEESENDFNYQSFFNEQRGIVYHDVASCIALAAVKTAYSSNAKVIFVFTSGGSTARLLSRFRPKLPILAMTSNKKSFEQLAISWGVIPFFHPPCKNFEEAFSALQQFALEKKYVTYGDLVVVTAGSPFNVVGTTNMMLVESIGDVLVRGYPGEGGKVHGKVKSLPSSEHKKPYEFKDLILMIGKCDETYFPFIRESFGVILHNRVDDLESEEFLIDYAKKWEKPFILRADGASNTLKEGQLVTLDAEKGLVYKGVAL